MVSEVKLIDKFSDKLIYKSFVAFLFAELRLNQVRKGDIEVAQVRSGLYPCNGWI